MDKKIDNLLCLELDTNILIMYDHLKEWRKNKPNHKGLDQVMESFTKVSMFINTYKTERYLYEKALEKCKEEQIYYKNKYAETLEKFKKYKNEDRNRFIHNTQESERSD
tara:strand:- start:1074 stop:1400 length:327 start_codon:yes stop_codon:yes gene_type:complete